ncbi:BrnA antitoxin of type II toxin-antitoxin system [Ruminococcaceae bacterium YRB3002]|nr:BrnA antitoxin of type II toxin-antitoxin system [Ruminococcaceae bacterium YRB3002]
MARTKKTDNPKNTDQDLIVSVDAEEQRSGTGKPQKKVITISLETDTIDYFKASANRLGIPYQTLINLCLKDIRDRELVPQFRWESKE